MELQNGIRILSIPSMAWLSDTQKQNVRVWIEALRSKKYEQGKGFLKTIDNKFCCLGVACDVVSDIFKTHWKGGPEDVCYSLESSTISGEESVLPEEIQKFYGFKHRRVMDHIVLEDIKVPVQKMAWRGLPSLNDDEGATFEDIANILEVAIDGGYVRPGYKHLLTRET